MEVKTYFPGEKLKQYIDRYYTLHYDAVMGFSDYILPGGHMEMAFNLGGAVFNSGSDAQMQKDPPVELLGQITKPKKIETTGKIDMLCVRFFPHTACCFINGDMGIFKNNIYHSADVLGSSVCEIQNRLLENPKINERLALIENFLLARLNVKIKNPAKLSLIGQLTKELQMNGHTGQINETAAKFGISSRYLHKLFSRYVGLSPKSYAEINRFNESIRKIQSTKESLTSIAYDCGYSDQSHFIRDFKSFSGDTPSAYLKSKRLAGPGN